MPKPLVNAVQQFFNTSGVALAGGKLFSFAAGTNTPQATYTDETAGTPNANPTILDANGKASVWITNAGYKFQLQDSIGNVIWTVDNVYLIDPNSVGAVQFANSAVGTSQLAANPITTAKIGAAQITTALLAAGAVTTGTIANGTIEVIDLDPNIDLTQLLNTAPSVFQRRDDFSAANLALTPQFPWSAPSQLGNPGTLPASVANDAKWSPDGRFLAVGHAITPFVTIYERCGTTLTKLTNPATLPASTVHGVAWSPNGDFLVCVHDTTPFITIYQRQGINFTKLSDPAVIPDSNGFAAAFSPNGEFLAVVNFHVALGTVEKVYQIQGTTFTEISNNFAPNALAGGSHAVAWSPDSQYLAMGSWTSNAIVFAQRVGANFNAFATITAAGFPSGLAWSPDQQFLAVSMTTSPFLAIYQFAGGTFNLLSAPAVMPSTQANGVAWSPDGSRLAVAFNASPFLLVYARNGSIFTADSNPAALPAGQGAGVAFSPQNRFLSIAVGSTPFINTYQTASAMAARGLMYSSEFLDV